mgnify:CR=1 FL=1
MGDRYRILINIRLISFLQNLYALTKDEEIEIIFHKTTGIALIE